MAGEENLTNVEDDAPVAPPVEAPPEPPVAELPAEPEDSDLDNVDLKDENRVKGLIAALARERARVKELKPKAEAVDQIQQWYQQNQPYVEVLKQNPDLWKRPAAPEPPKEQEADPDVVEYAQLFQLYKNDGSGQLDLKAAEKALAIAEKRAEKKARAAVEPMQMDTYQQRSEYYFQQALQIRDAEGNTPNPQTLRAIWQNMPVKFTADPQVAGMLAAQALGLDSLKPRKKGVPPPPKPPLETESQGGPTRQAVRLTEIEQRTIAQRGLKPEAYAKLTEGFRQGRTNVIEED